MNVKESYNKDKEYIEILKKQNIAIKMLQLNYIFTKIKNIRTNIKDIYIKVTSNISYNSFYELRTSVLTIQYFINKHKEKKESINNINDYYLNMNIQKDNDYYYYIQKYLFPQKNIIQKEKTNLSYYILDKKCLSKPLLSRTMTNISLKSQKILNKCRTSGTLKLHINNNNSTKKLYTIDQYNNNNLLYPSSDIYPKDKIKLFTRILCFDCLSNVAEIINSNWIDDFTTIYNTQMKANTPIQLIALGDTHTILINSKAKVYSFGWNDKCQCGIDKDESISLISSFDVKNLPFPNIYENKNIKDNIKSINNPIKKITVFEDKNYCIDFNGDVIVFGDNKNGELMLLNNTSFTYCSPIKLKNLYGPVDDIKVNKYMTIILYKSGELRYFYNNTDAPSHINIPNINSDTKDNEFNSTSIKKNIFCFKKKISLIGCGINFTLLLTRNGAIYGLGKNNVNQLGLDIRNGYNNIDIYTEPVENKYFRDDPIKKLSCGLLHTICLSIKGNIYTFGSNYYGQIGKGLASHSNYPELIETNKIYFKPYQILAGSMASIILDDKKNIYYSGRLDKDNISRYFIAFNYENKNLFLNRDEFPLIRLVTTWNRNMSILYATFADIRGIRKKIGFNIISSILDTISKKIEYDSICIELTGVTKYLGDNFYKK